MIQPLENHLSVSIVWYLSPVQELAMALVALAAAIERSEIRSASISLIDNSEDGELDLGSFDGILQDLEEVNCRLTVIRGSGNAGYGAGNNLVINSTKSRYLLIMNPDVLVDIDSIFVGISFLENHPDIAVVCPHAVNECGDKQYLCKRYPSVLDFFLRGFTPNAVRSLFTKRLSLFEMRDLAEDTPSSDIPIVSGCFMLCRAEPIMRVGGFDQRYFLYFEDFDLSLRLNQHYRLAYHPDMKIIHRGGNTSEKGLRHIAMFIKSAITFFGTHGWKWL